MNATRRRGIFNLTQEQIQGGLVLPALVGLFVWIMATHAWDAGQEKSMQAVEREMAQMQSQIRDLQMRCHQ